MIEIRALKTLDEFHAAVRLQKLIWGFDEVELMPVRLFVTATKVGGQAFGAFDAGRMIGFVMAIPGIKPAGNTSYLHSHMLGVMKEYRDAGVGRMLKLEQRRDALARGITLMEWTFDPLEIKNAYFNIERLGAMVRRYVLNQYGTTTSALHAGLPTDRCVAEWQLASARVETILAGGSPERTPAVARISIPSQIDAIKHTDPRARQRDSEPGERSVHGTFFEQSRGHGVRAHARSRHVYIHVHVYIHTMGFQIERIALRQIRMPLVHFFETSFGRTYERHIVLVEVLSEGLSGWGEITAGENPFYNEEWTDSAWLIARDFVAPRVLKHTL